MTDLAPILQGLATNASWAVVCFMLGAAWNAFSKKTNFRFFTHRTTLGRNTGNF